MVGGEPANTAKYPFLREQIIGGWGGQQPGIHQSILYVIEVDREEVTRCLCSVGSQQCRHLSASLSVRRDLVGYRVLVLASKFLSAPLPELRSVGVKEDSGDLTDDDLDVGLGDGYGHGFWVVHVVFGQVAYDNDLDGVHVTVDKPL
jgi:hypothetical protein